MTLAFRLKPVAAIAALFALYALPAQAVDPNGRFGVRGIGQAPCSVFSEAKAKQSQDLLMFGGWIDGFLTAANMHLPQTYDLAPWQRTELLAAIIDNQCQQKPDAPFAQIVREMTRALEPHRLTAESEMQTIEEGDKQTRLSVATLSAVQQRLKQEGLYNGSVDGRYGPNTRDAIAAFQRKSGEQETSGFPDQLTLLHLLLNN